MIILDGSYGEGGGQMLRTALLLSLLTDQPFRIENIRRGRSDPGLKPQHLHIVQALRQMSEVQVEGLAPGALALTFYPARLRGGVYEFDIGTAGAIPLFLQTLLPAAIFAGEPIAFCVAVRLGSIALVAFAMPKSSSLISSRPSAPRVRNRFPGLRSRWMMPAE